MNEQHEHVPEVHEPISGAASVDQVSNIPERSPAPNGDVAGHASRYAQAGRKGAERIHELIRQGRLYEQEHGLKAGRQRLRQLIQEGKLYEEEHRLRPAHSPKRRPRMSDEQALRALLYAIARVSKPAYRSPRFALE
jgi:hypothetical protein